MVSNSRLKDWLNSQIDTIDVSFTELNWPLKYQIPLYDFACNLSIEDKIFHGRGTSAFMDEAIIKSFVESCERFSLKKNGLKNSNGVAFHENHELAKTSALNELIERDSFFCHYLTKTPFRILNVSEISKSKANLWRKNFSKLGIDFIFAKMHSPDTYHSTITAAFGANCSKPWGLIFGTACSNDLTYSIEKSFIEASRAIAEKIETGLPEHISAENFPIQNESLVHNHYRLSLDMEYSKKFRDLYFSDLHYKCVPANPRSVKYNSLNIEFDALKGIPIAGAHAFSEEFQSVFFGIDQTNINFNRLKVFRPDSFILQDLPHPFR